MTRLLAPLLVSSLFLAACGGESPSPAAGGGAASASPAEIAPALPPGSEAYAVAGDVPLEPREPEEWEDLHNVFHLSDDIISGSEPHGEEALKRIAAMGVKTILSVDGKEPDQATAAKYGMRYVHVPIQYKGISPEERLRLAKTFRELEGPFFVHCFHGKHRGPAAAALGRLVLDGAPRDQAVAEMRQYCGTSGKYAGLYETIARGVVPTEEETRALVWDFPAAHTFEGFRGVMVAVTRAHDHLKATAKRAFEPDPEHPDLHPRNEAARLKELFTTALQLSDTQAQAEDYRAWLEESADHAALLVERLGELEAENPPEGSLTAAMDELKAVTERCDQCHKVYRNN